MEEKGDLSSTFESARPRPSCIRGAVVLIGGWSWERYLALERVGGRVIGKKLAE